MSTDTQLVVCGQCGSALSGPECAHCGHRVGAPIGVSSTWRGPWTPASTGAVGVGVAIDLGLAIAAGALFWFAATLLQLRAAAALVVGAVAMLVVAGVTIDRTLGLGRSLGHRLTHARLLSRTTGLPAGRLGDVRQGRLQWVSTAGTDPLRRLGLEPQASASGPRAQQSGRRTLSTTTPTVTLSDGTRTVIGDRLVVGRYPMRRVDGVTSLEINDLTRTLGRRHVVLESDAQARVTATDLGSANGTTMTIGTSTVRLAPNQPVPLALPCTLICGEQMVTIALTEPPRRPASDRERP